MLRSLRRAVVIHLKALPLSLTSARAMTESVDMESNRQGQLFRLIADRMRIPHTIAKYVVEQSKRGSTVPFLARYRRDETGNLDETAIRQLLDMAEELSEVQRRREFMLKSLHDRGLLTPELRATFVKLVHLSQLEDAWEPFKEKRTSLAYRAREAGLEPLAHKLLHTIEPMNDLQDRLCFVEDGQKLFQALVVEEVQRCAELREIMLAECRKYGVITSSLVEFPRKKSAKDVSKQAFDNMKKQFSPYNNRRWYVHRISAHHVLALQRGEAKGVLQVKVLTQQRSESLFFAWSRKKFLGMQRRGDPATSRLLKQCLDAAFDHVIKATHSTVRRDLKKSAEKEAIAVFAHNLRHILLQCPLRDARVLAMDPGFAKGVKCVALNENGKVLTRFHCTVMDENKMKECICNCVQSYELNKIVIGNGTGSQRVASVVADAIEEKSLKVEYAIVSETGASVYSVSDVAKEEFPTLDPIFRGAVSIGRRVIDPLSELVKIPVRSMGIGMYQHDVSEQEMTRALNRVVESCVTTVGVNTMVANRYIMEKIPGVSKRMVDQIVLARHARKLVSREDLRRVPGMTESMYRQIAGFFRFPNSSNSLDNSNIHPESYPIVEKLVKVFNKERKEVGDMLLRMSEKELVELGGRVGCGKATLELVAKELVSPALDPRKELPAAAIFRRAPKNAADLKPGDRLSGVIESVTTFGVFVDAGLHDKFLVRGVDVDTVCVGGVLSDIYFEGLDELGRVTARYGGKVHAIGGGNGIQDVKQRLTLESEEVISTDELLLKGHGTLTSNLEVVRGERMQLFGVTESGEKGDQMFGKAAAASEGESGSFRKRHRARDEGVEAEAPAAKRILKEGDSPNCEQIISNTERKRSRSVMEVPIQKVANEPSSEKVIENAAEPVHDNRMQQTEGKLETRDTETSAESLGTSCKEEPLRTNPATDVLESNSSTKMEGGGDEEEEEVICF